MSSIVINSFRFASGGAFTPLSLGSLQFWGQNAYSDTPPTTLVTVDTNAIFSVKDESAGAYHVSEVFPNQPAYRTAQFGALPGWSFNGGAHALRNTTLGGQLSGDFTVGLIYKEFPGGHVSDGMILMWGDLAVR